MPPAVALINDSPSRLFVNSLPERQIPSASEEVRATPPTRTMVSDFHDRLWLPLASSGDSSAVNSTALASLSEDPHQRSSAAHLYALRGTRRLISQLTSVLSQRLGGIDEQRRVSLAADVEGALGAALQSEFCLVLDEVSCVHSSFLSSKRTATPSSSPLPTAERPRASAKEDSASSFWSAKLREVEGKHELERAQMTERIASLERQVEVLERTLHDTLRIKSSERRHARRQ